MCHSIPPDIYRLPHLIGILAWNYKSELPRQDEDCCWFAGMFVLSSEHQRQGAHRPTDIMSPELWRVALHSCVGRTKLVIISEAPPPKKVTWQLTKQQLCVFGRFTQPQ